MENVLETLVLADYEIVFRMDGRTGEYRKILAKPAVGSLYPDSGILGDEACLKYMASVYPKDRILLRTEMSPERLAETAKTGHRKIVSYRRRDPGGRLLYRKAVIVPVPDRTGFVCAIHDTTEEMRLRRENDRNLRMKDEGIRFIVENMCENFIIADTETHECTTYTNREGNISCKSRFDEQIDWFAENMVVPEERAYYRRYFDIDTLTGRIAEEGICRMTCSVIYKNDRRTFAITATLIDDPGKNEKPPFLFFVCAGHHLDQTDERNEPVVAFPQPARQADGTSEPGRGRKADSRTVVCRFREGREHLHTDRHRPLQTHQRPLRSPDRRRGSPAHGGKHAESIPRQRHPVPLGRG